MRKALEDVVSRALVEPGFRKLLREDPNTALAGYDLTPDEIAALREGNSERLMSLGIDERMAKLF